jgi:epoxyqueuosine reductase
MPESLESQVRAIAAGLGFDECRFAEAREARHGEALQEWLDKGEHGDMAWMEKAPERRRDPRLLVEGANTVIVLALNYAPQGVGEEVISDPLSEDSGKTGLFARYAWGEDYHLVIDKKLKAFARELEGLGGEQRFYVDYGPVLERDFASDAGLGWNGKSTVQIHPKLGTWFFLAELVTTLELTPDKPMPDRCGKCTACIDCCPTDAITSVRHVDARRCISYLTIEHLGSIPEEFREAIGDRLFGCDDCLAVCPWNRFAQASKEARFAAREFLDVPLREFLSLDDETFGEMFRRSPVKRTGRERFLRNVCVALGNVGGEGDLPALKAAEGEGELVAEHARWAIGRIRARLGDASVS